MRGRGGARRAAAFVLALSWALAFAGCEGDGGGSPAAPTPALAAEASAPEAPPAEAPPPQETPDAPVTLTVAQSGSSGGTTGTEPNQVVGPADPVTLVDGGSADGMFPWTGSSAAAIRAPWQVTSEDETVVTAQFVSDAAPPYVNIAPAGPGETTVVVTAATAAGSATQRISATVEAAEAPRVIGEIPPAVLVVGARGIHWSLDAVFEPAGLRVEVESPDDEVVLAEGVDGYGGSLTLAPVGPGEVSVTVTASNAAGHADATMAVTVLDKLRIGLASRAGPPGVGSGLPRERGCAWRSGRRNGRWQPTPREW